MDLIDFIHRATHLHGNIAHDVWPNGATLTCSECKAVRHISAAMCAEYLARGWPKCCGYTMTVAAKKP